MQDQFLNELTSKKIACTVFTINGVQLKGTIETFDNFILIMNVNGKQQMLYKHAVSTIAPSQNIHLQEKS